MTAFACAYLAVLGARVFLRALNLHHLRRHGHRIPAGFEDRVDPDVLARSSDYTWANARLELLEALLVGSVLLWFLVGGGLAAYDRLLATRIEPDWARCIAFFLGLHYAQSLLHLPFQLYRTFRVEAQFGFNRTTLRLWLADLVKSELLASVILAILASTAWGLIHWSPAHWWLWLWLFFAAFTLFLMYLAPYVIEPLFFTFSPVKEEGLETAIRDLMTRAGLAVSRVFQVDASRRSSHSNAYFTGIGKIKRIVLFDTLLEQMDRTEIVAVLAHEVGHWKRHHIAKRIVATQSLGLLALYVGHQLLHWDGLARLAAAAQLDIPARLLLLAVLASLLLFPLTPLSSLLSRRHERQADDVARELTGNPAALASALAKLAKENLANLHPHPLYAWFYYSHPPIAQRVARLLHTE